MVAVVAAPEHMEKEVELSRRRVPGYFHSEMARRSSMPG
jgi:hypothetical protein